MSVQESRILARNRHKYLEQYYIFMEEGYDHKEPSSNYDFLLSNPLFSDLRKIYLEGIPESSVFLYHKDFTNQVSDEQFSRLLNTRFNLLSNYEVLSIIVSEHCGHSVDASINDLNEVKEILLSNKFVRKLFALYDQKKISEKELLFRLQEDAYWRSRLNEWEILGVSKRKKENDQYLESALSYDDIVEQTGRELGL